MIHGALAEEDHRPDGAAEDPACGGEDATRDARDVAGAGKLARARHAEQGDADDARDPVPPTFSEPRARWTIDALPT